MVEIIWIALVLVLELVEEIEDVKGEYCCRSFDRCRKPVCTEELNAFGKGSIMATATVTDDETVDTG